MAISQAIAPRNAKNRPYVLKKGVSVISDLADGGAVYGYPGDYYGRIYYVNNITGDSGYDGLSWDTPFDEISTAITASETYRALPSSTTNDYQRNIIYVQGTGTAYSALTALPSYCDVIGIGANPRGNGAGIVRIIDNTASTDAVSGTARGLYMANIQMGSDAAGGSTGYALDLANCFRSTFENCVFWNKTSGGVRAANLGGVDFIGCQIGGGDTSNGANGFEVTGDAFNNCWLIDNYIYGTTNGIVIAAATTCNNTMIKNNFIYGATLGVDDNSTASSVTQQAFFIENWVQSTDCFSIATDGANKCIGNWANAAGTSAYEDAEG